MKFLYSILLSVPLVLLGCGLAFGHGGSGPCVNCHTMHDSQDNQSMSDGTGPNSFFA
ncbi:MAG: hypothetical protein RQ753_01590 [Desulfurivibrionaceae bacterium]|nr:hypothetical protein [Desulfobulbales bacterium]MDT8334367.1 hypothetical protein [Desulfurivibrionaceae bacterium]